jgi:ADP-ribose pyrophosphatase
MSAANFKLVVLDVKLAAGEEPPLQKLDDGEHIVKRIVELSKLYAELKSLW